MRWAADWEYIHPYVKSLNRPRVMLDQVFGKLSLLFGVFLIGNLSLLGCTSNRVVSQQEDSRKDMVNIGYGEIEKDRLTGAVTTVNAEEARQAGAKSLAEMLAGRVAGVDVTTAPGGGIKVRIRGSHSMTGNNEPLFVVDGMPLMNTSNGVLRDINPYDIESISVLKDVASTAIYGVRGGNGVILIRTRLGQ